MQQETAFSAVLFNNDVTNWPTLFFYRGKRTALFCCRGRIEIKCLFSWLLQNNLLKDKNSVGIRNKDKNVFLGSLTTFHFLPTLATYFHNVWLWNYQHLFWLQYVALGFLNLAFRSLGKLLLDRTTAATAEKVNWY